MLRSRRPGSALVLFGLTFALAGCAGQPLLNDPTGSAFLDRFLGFIANPNVAYLLLVLGLLALIAEVATPGAVIPGVVGALMLLLSLYALLQLPTNWLGALLIVAGIAMMLIDINAPGVALSVGGVIAFLLGSLMIFTPPWQIAQGAAARVARLDPLLILGTTAAVGAFFILGVAAAFRAQRRPIAVGRETLIGQRGIVRRALDPAGIVRIEGEEWTAETSAGDVIPAGERVRVVRLDGLRLQVERDLSASERSASNG